MQFLVLNERRSDKFSDEELMPKVPAEFERVREMYSDSFVRQIWHRGDVPGGALIVEGESQDAVEATLATLPLVEAGMVEVASVIPLKPFAGFCP